MSRTMTLETTAATLTAMTGPFEVKLAADGMPTEWVRVATLAEASAAVRAYIGSHGFGASDWTGGEIRRANLRIGRVNYNGSLRSVAELRGNVRGW
jgi:hypothetical protein